VLEARDRIGGRVWSVRDELGGEHHRDEPGGERCGELGAELIETGQKELRQLADELGLNGAVESGLRAARELLESPMPSPESRIPSPE
jgi:monoamine oxidase